MHGNAPVAVTPESLDDVYLLCFSDPDNPVIPVRIEVVDAGKHKFDTDSRSP